MARHRHRRRQRRQLATKELTETAYKRTRTELFRPLPIPAKGCIPTMASAEQTDVYEAQFAGVPRENLDNQTISDLLKIYSSSDNEQIHIGKISFLCSFFEKIIAKSMSLDVVILCRDLETQHYLFSILQSISLNCNNADSYSDRRNTFGVIVKIREAGRPTTPIKQATKVDLVLVYDSAFSVPKRVLSQFKGVGRDRPLVAHISTIDSADIRCYQHPTVHKQYIWHTKYKTIKDAQQIFHQPNRRATPEDFATWNDYIATEVADWVALKQNIPYQFFRPHKEHAAINAYGSWGGAHSLKHVPTKAHEATAVTTSTARPGPSSVHPSSSPSPSPSSSPLIPYSSPSPSPTPMEIVPSTF